MKEKSIIFSTPMVEAILNGKKTQTRRVVIPQPGKDDPNIRYCTLEGFQCAPPGEEIWADTDEGESVQLKPKYEKGDLLWVRETWTCKGTNDKDLRALISYECGNWAWVQFNDPERYKKCIKKYQIKQPSIFLQREAARLFLEVKSVCVERLQDISPEDAVFEGAVKNPHYIRYGGEPCLVDHNRYREEYAALWDSLNAKRGYSWESNPWVWVYEFMRLPKGGEYEG